MPDLESCLIHHRQTHRLLVVLLFVCSTTAASWGQALTGDAISASDAGPFQGQIDKYVAAQLKRLSGTDARAQMAAREALVKVTTSRNASPAFLDAYSESLNRQLEPIAQNKDVRVRLNAAIVTARVAKRAANTRLAKAAQAFVMDKSDAVVLWGLKAAQCIVPPLISSQLAPGANQLGAAAVSSVKSHPGSAAIIEDAYNTVLLSVDPDLADIDSAALGKFVAQPMALFDYRVSLYADGVPPEPRADEAGSAFFVKSKVWQAQTPAQQAHNLQSMVALCRGAAKQNAAEATPELLDVIRRTGEAIKVAGNGFLNNPALGKAGGDLAGISSDTAAEDIETRIKAVEDAMKGPTSTTAGAPGAAAQATGTTGDGR
ncbi:MAG TPA: hypothetical protein VFC78_18665 [Tepidisphaeraceae bacterium]|nr:hypothetical protein [Tepidisphaeraceae bacterium]